MDIKQVEQALVAAGFNKAVKVEDEFGWSEFWDEIAEAGFQFAPQNDMPFVKVRFIGKGDKQEMQDAYFAVLVAAGFKVEHKKAGFLLVEDQ